MSVFHVTVCSKWPYDFIAHLMHQKNGRIPCPYVCQRDVATLEKLERDLRSMHRADGIADSENAYQCDVNGCGRSCASLT